MDTFQQPPPLRQSISSPPGPGVQNDLEVGLEHGLGKDGARGGFVPPPPLDPVANPLPGHAGGPRRIGMSDYDLSAPSLQSPGIKVEFHDGETAKPAGAGAGPGPRAADDGRPPLVPHPKSAPAVQQFQSPMRQHKRTPSQHREVKETLNARSEYTSDDADGQTHLIINQYTVLEEIGRGSYGAVHRAVDQYGHEFAVKEFSKTRLRKRAQSNILRRGPRRPGPRFPFRPSPGPGAGQDPTVFNQLSDQKAEEAKDALFLIREETAIMKKLNHPNLVSLIEVLDDPEEDSLYMVLEMCKKGVIMKVGLEEVAPPYGEEECRCWFRDLILGIEYLHAQGVVHRDIKPDNLLLTEDDVLKIVDFGVSEMFEKPANMRTAKSAGSPAFLPPELCVAKHGDVSGKAADIWSMGVSLYCLRYGHIPFNRSGVLEMYEAIKEDTAVLPEDENPSFKDLMNKLLEKDPEKRITMNGLREHPWITKEGVDPLLSTEENCSDPVEPPNALEIDHAFTRRMSHLLCVMKAISNFKALLSSRSRLNSPRLNLSPSDAASPTQPHHPVRPLGRHKPKPSMDEQELAELKRANEAHAARLLEERMRVRQTRGSGSGEHPPPHHGEPVPRNITKGFEEEKEVEEESAELARTHGEPPELHPPPPVLGIGTGIGHHPASDAGDDEPPSAVVADSPTAVDFNVYDAAYEAEIERIKRSDSGARRPNAARASVYLTWHLGDRARRKAEEVRTRGEEARVRGGEALDLLAEAATEVGTEIGNSVEAHKERAKEVLFNSTKSNRFADLVAQTIKDTKVKFEGTEEGSADK